MCINDYVNKTFQCNCSQGYYGNRCQNETDECLSMPCENGGLCKDLVCIFLHKFRISMVSSFDDFEFRWCMYFYLILAYPLVNHNWFFITHPPFVMKIYGNNCHVVVLEKILPQNKRSMFKLKICSRLVISNVNVRLATMEPRVKTTLMIVSMSCVKMAELVWTKWTVTNVNALSHMLDRIVKNVGDFVVEVYRDPETPRHRKFES